MDREDSDLPFSEMYCGRQESVLSKDELKRNLEELSESYWFSYARPPSHHNPVLSHGCEPRKTELFVHKENIFVRIMNFVDMKLLKKTEGSIAYYASVVASGIFSNQPVAKQNLSLRSLLNPTTQDHSCHKSSLIETEIPLEMDELKLHHVWYYKLK